GAARIRQRTVEVSMPDLLAGSDVDSKEVVGYSGDDGHLARPSRRRHALGHQWRKQVVHRARRALELQLPEKFRAADVRWREDLLAADPTGARVVDSLGQEIRPGNGDRRQEQKQKSYHDASNAFVLRRKRTGIICVDGREVEEKGKGREKGQGKEIGSSS